MGCAQTTAAAQGSAPCTGASLESAKPPDQERPASPASSFSKRIAASLESTDSQDPRGSRKVKVTEVVEEAESRQTNQKAGMMRKSRLCKNKRIHDHYKIGDEMLGHGAFGVVFNASSLVTGADVAVKVVPTMDMDVDKFQSLFNEVENCLHMDHPNICRIFEVYEDENSLQLVMEKCTGEDLFNHLAQLERYSERDASRACKQMLEAVNYCHVHNVCHRDLKLDNWVYKDRSSDSLLKLIDFGFSKVCGAHGKSMSAVLGTCYYVAPEVVNGPAYDSRCDLWSLGVVTYMLLTGQPPFWGGNTEDVLAKVRGDAVPYEADVWQNYTPLARDFVEQLLTRDVELRPSAAHMLKHKWLPHDDFEGHVEETHIDPQVLTNMRTFAQFTGLKRMALALMAAHFTHTEVHALEEQFQQLDYEKNGSISVQEFTAVLAREAGMTKEEAEKLFAKIDCLDEHEISYTEFLGACQSKELLQDRYMREAFAWFDRDGDGFITVEDMKTVCGEEVDGTPALQVVQDVDHKCQGKIDFEEWREFLIKDQGPRGHREAPGATGPGRPVQSDASTSTRPSDSPRSLQERPAAEDDDFDVDIGVEDVRISLVPPTKAITPTHSGGQLAEAEHTYGL